MNKQVHLFISGYVQGVFFRASASDIARKLKLTGFVKNLSDGRVEIVAEGDESMLARLIEWCQRGPAGARVDGVESDWASAKNQFQSFQIR